MATEHEQDSQAPSALIAALIAYNTMFDGRFSLH